MIREAQSAAVLWLASSLALAQAALPAVSVRIVAPVPGEPAIDRVDVAIEVDAGEATIVAVELEIDGEVAHSWREPPFEATHDFGMSGRGRRLVARALGPEGVLAQAELTTPEVRIGELVDLDLQQIYLTVTDRRGVRISGLGRESFTIKDSDLEQEIVTFGVGEIPFTAVLLVDSSLSMRGRRLEAALAAARRFVAGMRPLDQAQVISYSDRLLRATGVGGRSDLADALAAPYEAIGGTALRDHLYLAIRLLESRQGRRAILLLTDGWDQVSVLSMEKLEHALRRSQSVLYWVRLAGDEPTSFHVRSLDPARLRDFAVIRYQPAPSSWRDETRARRDYRDLGDLVAASGGRIAVAERITDMEAAVADVLDELHEQYAIGYYPSGRAGVDRAVGSGSGRWRPVSVKVRRRGLKVRTREGYVDRE